MNEHRPLRFRKKSAGGALERIELLRRSGFELQRLGAAAWVPRDDVLDARAAAWSTSRIAAGIAQALPDPPELVDGYPTAIWY